MPAEKIDTSKSYADGKLRTPAEWQRIRKAFAEKHALADAKKRKRPKQRERLF